MIFPTPTERGRPLIRAEFETLTDGLDYAATCNTGLNYYSARGGITHAMPYADLRDKAIDVAKRLVPFAEKNARIGLIAHDLPRVRYFVLCLSVCRACARTAALAGNPGWAELL